MEALKPLLPVHPVDPALPAVEHGTDRRIQGIKEDPCLRRGIRPAGDGQIPERGNVRVRLGNLFPDPSLYPFLHFRIGAFIRHRPYPF